MNPISELMDELLKHGRSVTRSEGDSDRRPYSITIYPPHFPLVEEWETLMLLLGCFYDHDKDLVYHIPDGPFEEEDHLTIWTPNKVNREHVNVYLRDAQNFLEAKGLVTPTI